MPIQISSFLIRLGSLRFLLLLLLLLLLPLFRLIPTRFLLLRLLPALLHWPRVSTKPGRLLQVLFSTDSTHRNRSRSSRIHIHRSRRSSKFLSTRIHSRPRLRPPSILLSPHPLLIHCLQMLGRNLPSMHRHSRCLRQRLCLMGPLVEGPIDRPKRR